MSNAALQGFVLWQDTSNTTVTTASAQYLLTMYLWLPYIVWVCILQHC